MLASGNTDFPGLGKLRAMGTRMAQMRRAGQQGSPDNPMGGAMSTMPAFNPSLNAPQNMPGGTFLGGGESGQNEADLMASQSSMPTAPGAVPEPPPLMQRPIAPPAISSLRDVRPGGQRGLGSYRNAGLGGSRRTMRGM